MLLNSAGLLCKVDKIIEAARKSSEAACGQILTCDAADWKMCLGPGRLCHLYSAPQQDEKSFPDLNRRGEA